MDRDKLVAIAGELFKQHGLDVQGWRLEFRNYGQRFGWCCSRRLVIALDTFYAKNNDEKLVLDTLTHEVAHALVGPIHGHGPIWKAMAMRLGCIPSACGNPEVVLRPGKWQASCPTCSRRFHKFRRPKYVTGYYCPSCGEGNGKLVFSVQGSEVA